MAMFAVGENATHEVGDARCPACADEFPEPCRCGGLVHAAEQDELDDEAEMTTSCDHCGRSDDELAEAV